MAERPRATRRTRPASGEEPPDDGDGGRADERRHRERLDDPQDHVLERVDVVDQAGDQVASAEEWQAGRGDRLEPLVDPHAQVGQRAQRGVVADEPLAVAEEAT